MTVDMQSESCLLEVARPLCGDIRKNGHTRSAGKADYQQFFVGLHGAHAMKFVAVRNTVYT